MSMNVHAMLLASLAVGATVSRETTEGRQRFERVEVLTIPYGTARAALAEPTTSREGGDLPRIRPTDFCRSPQGDIYIVDRGKAEVKRISPNGDVGCAWRFDGHADDLPTWVEADGAGRIYVCAESNLWCIGAERRVVWQVATGLPAGRLWLTDGVGRLLFGRSLRAQGDEPPPHGEFWSPNRVPLFRALPQGGVLVSLCVGYDKNSGERRKAFAIGADGESCKPVPALDRGSDGLYYDLSRYWVRASDTRVSKLVRVLDADGRQVRRIEIQMPRDPNTGRGSRPRLYAWRLGADDNIYARGFWSEPERETLMPRRALCKFSPTGELLATLSLPAPPDWGGIDDFQVDKEGNIYTMEFTDAEAIVVKRVPQR